MYSVPILYIVFNDLDSVQQTFPKIKEQRPKQLFISSDGPRIEREREREREKVIAVREWIESQIDWECKLHKLYRDTNLGCGVNVSKSISWFFENVESGIILEDDCLPAATFFSYCKELLERYKDNKKIMHIAGSNPVNVKNYPYSYYFTNVQFCWGWASWADRWKKYEFVLSDIKDTIDKLQINNAVKQHYLETFEKFTALPFEIDTWDYQWSFAIIKNEGMCINPAKNLIQNIGFVGERTHFNNNGVEYSIPVSELEHITHPPKIELNAQIQKGICKHITRFHDSLPKKILKKILKILGIFELVKALKNNLGRRK